MRYHYEIIRQNGQPEINFFKDPEFHNARVVLDAEMKRLQSMGLGSKHCQAEPLTEGEEELLWESGQLGDFTTSTIRHHTLMNSAYFALRSGQEHRDLRSHPPQRMEIEIC